jgi:hypothetical protein
MLGYRRVLEARNAATPADRLRTLAHDEIRPVRLWTARNIACPADVLDRLARDDDSSVRWAALGNPAMPESGLRYLAQLEAAETWLHPHDWFVVRRFVRKHPNASRRFRRELGRLGVR